MSAAIPSRPAYLYPTPGRIALVLAGGAARGAYEVGVLQYICEDIARELGRDPPIDIVCGTSVGAINGCAMAAFADAPRSRTRRLANEWKALHVEDVVRLNHTHLSKFLRAALGQTPLISEFQGDRYGGIIDPVGLEEIIGRNIPFPRIREHLNAGILHAVAVSATHVTTGNTAVFMSRAEPGVPVWSSDPKVVPVATELTVSHALASAALPLLFPAVRVGDEFYCDGGLRQNVPLSPARHLGASGLLVVSPRYVDEIPHQRPPDASPGSARLPGPAFLLGKTMNALLLDRVENDIERLQRINQILCAGQRRYGPDFLREINDAMGRSPERSLRPLTSLLIKASENIGRMAAEYVRSPAFGRRATGLVSRLVKRLAEGEYDDEADLLSYLMFDGEFAEQLIDLGRRDAKAAHDAIIRFFTHCVPEEAAPGQPPPPVPAI